MAKQSGIHQLRGKVGEMSYYRRKGVVPGLVRGINAGMSERVKNGEEFANTRLNNDEFRTANQLATFAFNAVPNRKRGMLRDFAIAYMTKDALIDIKAASGNWGYRRPGSPLDVLIADMLENFAKQGKYDGEFGIINDAQLDAPGNFEIEIVLSEEVQQSLVDLGIDGFNYVSVKGLAGFNEEQGEIPFMAAGTAYGSIGDVVLNPASETTFTLSGGVSTPQSVGMSQAGYTFATEDPLHGFFVIISFLPYRTVGNVRHTLQEFCTYVAIPLGKIPSAAVGG